MKLAKSKLIVAAAVVLMANSAYADEIGLSVPDASIYYYNPISSKNAYRFGATLGSPSTFYAMYRSRLGSNRALFWEIGISASSNNVDIPLSLGYRYKLDTRLFIEPMLTFYPAAATNGFNINIGYRL